MKVFLKNKVSIKMPNIEGRYEVYIYDTLQFLFSKWLNLRQIMITKLSRIRYDIILYIIKSNILFNNTMTNYRWTVYFCFLSYKLSKICSTKKVCQHMLWVFIFPGVLGVMAMLNVNNKKTNSLETPILEGMDFNRRRQIT